MPTELSKRLHRRLSLRAQTLNAEARTVEATIATERAVEMPDFDRWEMVPEVLRADGFRLPEGVDGVPFLDSHQRASVSHILGRVSNIRREGDTIVATLRFRENQSGTDALNGVREGVITDLSVGYEVEAKTYVEKGKTANINGRTYTGPVNVVQSWRVLEVSATPIGADEGAKIRELIQRGVTAPLILPQGRNTMELEDDNTTQETRGLTDRAAVLERERQTSINEHVELLAQSLTGDNAAIQLIRNRAAEGLQNGETFDSVRAAVNTIRRNAMSIPALNPVGYLAAQELSNNSRQRFESFGADAIRLRAGRAVDFGGNADRQRQVNQLAKLSIADMYRQHLAESGAMRGTTASTLSNFEVAEAIVQDLRRFHTAGFSERSTTNTTSRFPLLLTGALNAEIQEGFMLPETTWQQVAAVDSFNDLRVKELPQASEPPRLKKLGPAPNGEDQSVSYYTFTERGESYQLSIYKGGISFSEELIINDRFDVALDTASLMAAASSQQIDEDFWQTILSNPNTYGSAFFATGRGNYFEGASTTVLSAANLATAKKNFRLIKGMLPKDEQTNKQRKLAVSPRLLIVPPSLEDTALQLLNSTALVGADNSGVFNSARTGLNQVPIVVPHLEDPEFTGYSAKAWYLSAEARFRWAVVGFLRGRTMPMLDSMIDFDTDAIKWKIKHYWASKLLRPEYCLKMKGENA